MGIMNNKQKLVYVTKEKLPSSIGKAKLTPDDLAKISQEVKHQMKIECPLANLTTFIELEI